MKKLCKGQNFDFHKHGKIQPMSLCTKSKDKLLGCIWKQNKLTWSNWVNLLLLLFAPEYMVGKAVVDRVSASYNEGVMKALAQEDDVEWSLTHTFFANMGGFEIVFIDCATEEKDFEGGKSLSYCGDVIAW